MESIHDSAETQKEKEGFLLKSKYLMKLNQKKPCEHIIGLSLQEVLSRSYKYYIIVCTTVDA